MKKTIYYTFFFFIFSSSLFAQSIDDSFPQKKMRKDLDTFIEIRKTTNSGLYTYRTKKQIDSIYAWASEKISDLKTYRDFYNLLITLTDYEGSLHNSTYWPNKLWESIKVESKGYFPIPVKMIQGKLLVNSTEKHIPLPLGTEITSINGHKTEHLLNILGKYYTTDGFNTTGKKGGINKHFSRYYRYNFGLENKFEVKYKTSESSQDQSIIIESVSFKKYYENFKNRHSLQRDRLLYEDLEDDEYYTFKKIDAKTAVLTISSFGLGSGEDKSHLKYKQFLDSIFTDLNHNKLENLVIDIRDNGGGNKPNDMVTLSYLADSPQKEIRTAWIGFTETIPFWKYFQLDIPFYLKPFAKRKFKKIIREELPLVKNNRRYYTDIEIYQPNKNRFKGQVYLLINSSVASAASLFASMVASNTNAIVIGEETSGGYYGHNGSFPLEYKLPKSDFSTVFSIVNLTQDVKKKETQPLGRGVIPHYKVTQSYNDFITNKDAEMSFVLDLINKN